MELFPFTLYLCNRLIWVPHTCCFSFGPDTIHADVEEAFLPENAEVSVDSHH
jgi:hypothetical protein